MSKRFKLVHLPSGKMVGAGSLRCMAEECEKANARLAKFHIHYVVERY